MKKLTVLLAIAAAMVFSSCGASKFYVKNESSIRPIALVQPFSYLTDAIADFSTGYVAETSNANNAILSEVLSSVGLPIEKAVPFEYNYSNKSDELVRWMRHLANVGTASAKSLTIPAEFVEAVKASGCRYGLLLSDIGYVKNEKQYALEHAIDVGTKAMDLLFHNSLDLSKDAKAHVNGMFSLIFDSQTGEVVWYGVCPKDYKHDPLNSAHMQDQISKLYKALL